VRKTIQESFVEFHWKHPSVYVGLVRLAREGRRRGRTKLGIGQLFEVLRWEWMIEGLPDNHEQYKLNNNYRSRYARLIMGNEVDLEGIFDVRELKSA
jgi:hypothetical protein